MSIICTLYNGLQIDLLKPNLKNLKIEDIAHPLSRLNRFNGQIKQEWYSIAEHCILGSYFVPSEYALEFMLHDASEGLGFGDMITPLKHCPEMGFYDVHEKQMGRILYRHFGVKSTKKSRHIIKNVDYALYCCEKAVLTKLPLSESDELCMLDADIKCLSPNKAKRRYLKRYYELKNL